MTTSPDTHDTAPPTAPTGRSGTSSIAAALPPIGLALLVNLVLLGIGTAAGASLVVEQNGRAQAIGIVPVVLVTVVPLLLAAAALHLVVHRFDALRRAWVPVVLVLTAVSMVGLTGAEDLGTALTLAPMHLVSGAVAAFVLPRRTVTSPT